MRTHLKQLPSEMVQCIKRHVAKGLSHHTYVDTQGHESNFRVYVSGNDILSIYDDVYDEVDSIIAAFPQSILHVDMMVDQRCSCDARMVFWTDILDSNLLDDWIRGIPPTRIVLQYWW